MVEYNTSTIVFNILKLEIGAPSLRIKDLFEIKTSINLSFSMKLLYILKIFHRLLNIIPPDYINIFGNFNSFIRYVSYYEIESIAYTYTLNTFDVDSNESFERSLTCPRCENVFKYDLSIKDFVNINKFKIWDKDKNYFDYRFNYEVELDNQVKITICFFIPNILTFITRIRGLTKQTILQNINQHNSILDPITELTLHTKYIKVDNISIELPNDIYDFYSKIPAQIFNNIFKYYTKNILIYKPKYESELKCPKCNTPVKIQFSPLLEFLNIVEHSHITKILDEYIDLYQVLFITTNEHFTSFREFFELPYPIYIKISKEFLKSYEKRLKMYQSKKFLDSTKL